MSNLRLNKLIGSKNESSLFVAIVYCWLVQKTSSNSLLGLLKHFWWGCFAPPRLLRPGATAPLTHLVTPLRTLPPLTPLLRLGATAPLTTPLRTLMSMSAKFLLVFCIHLCIYLFIYLVWLPFHRSQTAPVILKFDLNYQTRMKSGPEA